MPTRLMPASPRSSAIASREVSPPGTGVPVPGANAGSIASTSNVK
jgi:hypothetical protein